jgi:hypothetical protein
MLKKINKSPQRGGGGGRVLDTGLDRELPLKISNSDR